MVKENFTNYSDKKTFFEEYMRGDIAKLKLLPANIKIVIEGKRIILRPISEKEINKRYISWLNDPEINKFLEIRYKRQSVKDVISYINSLRLKKGCEIFAILTKKENIHIGNIAITDYNPNNQGYAIYGLMIGDMRAQMLGFGGEATVLIIEYLFSKPIIRRVQAGAISDNYKSWKIFDFLGFRKEGVLREHSVLPSGKINDAYIYGILRKEWFVNRKRINHILRDIKITKYKKE